MQSATDAVRASGGAIERGEKSEAVKMLQVALAAAGHNPGPIDGEFGPATYAAVRDFQRAEKDLTADGVVGPLTAAALDRTLIPMPPSEAGPRPPEEPRWVSEGRKLVGLREIAGPRDAPQILEMWGLIKSPFKDDETPWCAGYVGATLEKAGIVSSRSAWARSYLGWGRRLPSPAVGCVVAFERGPTSGHVGFVVGKTASGRLKVLGGNQSDMVSIADFDRTRVLGYRWPLGEPDPERLGWDALPVMKSGTVSQNEA